MVLTFLTGSTTPLVKQKTKNNCVPTLTHILRLSILKEFDEAVIKINLSIERRTSCSQMADL